MGVRGSAFGFGLTILVFGIWSLALWYVSGWTVFGTIGGVLAGTGLLWVMIGLFFRWRGWE
jgi:hypothetical protein